MRTALTSGHLAPLALVAALAAAAGCSSSSSKASSSDGGAHPADAPAADTGKHADAGKPGTPDAAGSADAGTEASTYVVPPSWNQAYTQPSDTAATASRASCTFARGAMPAQTLGPATALDRQIPIEHVVVFMQENRSFDSYLGHLQAYEATKGITNTIESPPAGASNPSYPANMLDGGAGDAGSGSDAAPPGHPWMHAPQLCSFDTAHSWGAAHIEYDKGANDGFYYANNDTGDTGESTQGIAPAQLSGERSLWWYDQTDLPFAYDLYSTFAMADHYHSALLGPTYPNRMYLYSATSFGVTTNLFPDISAYPTPETPVIIFDELAVRGVSFAWYTEGAAEEGVVLALGGGTRYGAPVTRTFTQFYADAKAGTLPQVSFLDGNNLNETTTGDDEHPPAEIEIGQHLIWQIVNAITTSPEWKSTVLFVVYDENGGFYDHVAPPSACPPDNLQPMLTDTYDQSQPGSFNQYGFRVPFVAISPFSKKSYVSHTTYSHTSITRFIEAKFKLPALTARDANADPFTDLFDWQNPPFMTPPTFTEPTINQAAVTQCTSELTATK
jgi:phospholipase C